MQDTVGKQESRACWRAQVDAEPETGAQPVRSSILDTSGPGTEGRPRRAGDLGHLLPISGNSRNVQVRPRSTWLLRTILLLNRQWFCLCDVVMRTVGSMPGMSGKKRGLEDDGGHVSACYRVLLEFSAGSER